MVDRGINSWSDGASARERVREIATTLTQPRSLEWIQNEAQASRQTTTDELELLAEFGHIHAIETDDGTMTYAPNYQRRYFNELLELISTHTRSELRAQIATIQATIDEWKADFGVESRSELEATLTDNGLTSDVIHDRNCVLRKWDRLEANKRLLEHALALYDDARPVDYRSAK